MLRVLLKKQLSEVFKSYFFDQKKNKMRSKGAVVLWFLFFLLIMVGLLGGIFGFLALSICGSLYSVGMGWLYFLLMGGIAIFLGVFGSVFNTYSCLYLSKDNDLLLSMPIPVRTIMVSRLLNVFLMGTMYSATVFIPTLIVYWMIAEINALIVICGILQFFIISFIVLILSCLLGWVVAKISLKLKNKSYITALISLVFLGLYYFLYFRASEYIRGLIANAEIYGNSIKGAAYGLFLFGNVAVGDLVAAAVFVAAVAVLFAILWYVLSRSFIGIATATGTVAKVRYVEKTVKMKSPFWALLSKEFSRFTSSASYMLNCGLGVVLLPACGVLMLIKGAELYWVMDSVFTQTPGAAAIMFCTCIFVVTSMIDVAAPSVSLEGKSIWIPQSLPVDPGKVLRAKLSVQLLLTLIPVLFTTICFALVMGGSPVEKILFVAAGLAFALFSSSSAIFLGVRMPVMNWTNETAPIKQSGAVTIVLFGGWLISAGFVLLYMLAAYPMGLTAYLGVWTALLVIASLVLLRWVFTKGAKVFATLV